MLEVCPLHCVFMPPLLLRLFRWVVDGWGSARIYGYYILLLIYQYEHTVTIQLRGLEAVILNTHMGCNPLLHLRSQNLIFASRYSCDQVSLRLAVVSGR